MGSSGRKSVFLHSAELEKFPYPADIPFNTSRGGLVKEVVESMGLLSGPNVQQVSIQAAKRITLKKFHTARYLHALKTAAKGKWDIEALQMGIGTGDCPIFHEMYDYSAWACGATLKGAELVLEGDADVCFNPSGGLHHAGPEKASGFCYMNDVALACLVLTEAGKRVLYLDVDVHHGDGVVYCFYGRSDVLTISMHENPRNLFPGTGFADETGAGEGRGYCVNIPLPVGTYDEVYLKAFNEAAVPLIAKFDADVVVFELGADALAGDPLAHLQLTNNTYVKIIEHLLSLNRPVIVTGGGGYDIANTVRAWALAWSVLCGADEGQNHDMHSSSEKVILESKDRQLGLRDRAIAVSRQQRETVLPAINATIEAVKKNVFPIHRVQ